MDYDKNLHTECGVFALFSEHINEDYYSKTVQGLETLQHRGQESAGVAYIENNKFIIDKKLGLVRDTFSKVNKQVKTHMTLGHVRYSTSGVKTNPLDDVQPLYGNGNEKLGEFVIAHNGNIPHIANKTNKSDSHYIVELLEKTEKTNWRDALIDIHNILKGAYCIVILTNSGLYCMRDQYGYKPLCIGQRHYKNEFVVTSETCSFRILENYKIRKHVEPGEILMIDNTNGLRQIYKEPNKLESKCLFEYIYFMDERSNFDGIMIDTKRKQFGAKLAENDFIISSYIQPDSAIYKEDIVVIGCPNTGIIGGKGYAEKMGLQYEQLIVKKRHMNRTFILPTDEERKQKCREKYEIKESIKDKIVILVDDSIVRGNTMRILIAVLFEYGCREIHVRITSPPIKYPCYYGIDIPTSMELVAFGKTIIETRDFIGATSLMYIPIEHMKEMLSPTNVCSACFTGDFNEELF